MIKTTADKRMNRSEIKKDLVKRGSNQLINEMNIPTTIIL